MLLQNKNIELKKIYKTQTKEKLLTINLDTQTISYSQAEEECTD